MSEDGDECEVRPATPADLDWIFRLEIETYTAEYAVARAKLDEWFCANPDGFSVFTLGGRNVGQLTMLPLRPVLLEDFARGTIREQDIRGDSLYTPAERHLVRNLHVESIILRPAAGGASPPLKALVCLGRNFPRLVQRICEPENLERVYALGASGRGESLIRALGFRRMDRADPRRLYVANYSDLEANVSELYNRRVRNDKA